MNVSVPSILLSLGGKCLFNWGLVFLQRNLICRSFLGVFSISLAVVDTLLTLFSITTGLQDEGFAFFLDIKLTRYNVCLLVQILGQVYSALQWPVVIVAGLDHFFTITRRLQPSRARCLVVTLCLWNLAVFYIFLLSGFTPVMENVTHKQIHHCWVFLTSQALQVAVFLVLTLFCAGLHAWRRLLKTPLKDQSAIHPVLNIFLNTWTLFLVLLPVLLLLPAYLALNVAWLCFLNSLLIAVVLCTVCPASRLTQGLAAAPADYFCDWRFKFSLTAEDRA